MSAGGLVDFRRLLRFFARGRLDRPLDAKDWARSSLCAADQGYRVVPGGAGPEPLAGGVPGRYGGPGQLHREADLLKGPGPGRRTRLRDRRRSPWPARPSVVGAVAGCPSGLSRPQPSASAVPPTATANQRPTPRLRTAMPRPRYEL